MAEPRPKARKKAQVGDSAGFSFASAPPSAPAKPHFHDHRERLRARFEARPEAIADYELLELLLFRTIARRDVKPLAKALLHRFGDFAAVLGADPARIMEVDGAGAAVARDLKLIQAAIERAGAAAARRRVSVTSWAQLTDYIRIGMQHQLREQFRVLFLDRKNQLIADEVLSEGTVDHAPVYPREVVRRALELGASAMIVAHNHPSGDPAPSAADLQITKELIAAAKALDIVVHDHIVVGRSGTVSFKSLGLI